MLCSEFRSQIQSWLRDYDKIQHLAVILIYIQIGCALVGSLGALYNGVLLIDLGIALFALVAIESSSQSLGRTYAVLLFCTILLDILWFILFTHEIWNISSEMYGKLVIFSVKVTLSMQIIGFSVRLSSSLLWIQMYILGVSHVNSNSTVNQESDLDLRSSFLNPATPDLVRNLSGSDDILGGSIYDPSYYSSLFEEDGSPHGDHNQGFLGEGISRTSITGSPRLKPSDQNQGFLGEGISRTSFTGSPRLKPSISKSFQTSGNNHSFGETTTRSISDVSRLKTSISKSFQSVRDEGAATATKLHQMV